MSSATDKTVTVEFNPTATSKQSDIIAGATPTKAGCMTAAQAAELAALIVGSRGFVHAVSQPADGDDFFVTIPGPLVQTSTSYLPIPVIGTAGTFTGIAISLVDNTTTSFRVTTDGTLPDGTILGFIIRPLI